MPSKGGNKAGSGKMPVLSPSKSNSRPVFTSESTFPKTWSELESVKSRLALHMDRVEYLAGARNRLTDVNIAQARNLEFQLRTKTRDKQNGRISKDLTKSVSGVSTALEDHKQLMSSSQTNWKRLDAINKYVVRSEMDKAGVESAEAAKKSGKSAQPKPANYPAYQDLYNLNKTSEGKPREQPILAVYCSMPYIPPLGALQHGKKLNYDPSKSMTM